MKLRNLGIGIWGVLLLLSLLGLGTRLQAAEEYPVKPINFIVHSEAGAGGDIESRILCKKVSELLGKPVVVVNKPGAGGSIGLKEIHDAKPDGYTFGYCSPSIYVNKLQGIFPYDYRDFTIIGSSYFNYAVIIASNKTQKPFKTIEEVLSFAKSHPGEVSIATSGIGYPTWIATMAFQQKTGLKFNIIPQPGASGMVTAQVTGGHTDLGFLTLSAAKSQIDTGMVRFLVTTGPRRAPGYGNVPTLEEAAGYEVRVDGFGFVIGPPKLPKAIVDKFAKAWAAAVNDPEYQKSAIERNNEPLYMPPDKVISYLDGQRKVVRAIMQETGILKEK